MYHNLVLIMVTNKIVPNGTRHKTPQSFGGKSTHGARGTGQYWRQPAGWNYRWAINSLAIPLFLSLEKERMIPASTSLSHSGEKNKKKEIPLLRLILINRNRGEHLSLPRTWRWFRGVSSSPPLPHQSHPWLPALGLFTLTWFFGYFCFGHSISLLLRAAPPREFMRFARHPSPPFFLDSRFQHSVK